jgi:hypothetical protein
MCLVGRIERSAKQPDALAGIVKRNPVARNGRSRKGRSSLAWIHGGPGSAAWQGDGTAAIVMDASDPSREHDI